MYSRCPSLLVLLCILQFSACPPVSSQGTNDDVASEDPRPRIGLDEARHYMVSLINTDRKSAGLSPVVLDETASNAGQGHTDEMAQMGYIAHWGLDGKKPDQRYNEGGGTDQVGENAHLTGVFEDDEHPDQPPNLPLIATPTFSKKDLEDIESGLFNEKPPKDGHRLNILTPEHNRVGIALSESGTYDHARLACTQEFVNKYGEYSPIPLSLKLGQSFKVEGALNKGVDLYGIDLMREDLPKPMTIAELNKTYSDPDETVASYWPPQYQAPPPITLETKDGREVFSITISVPESSRKGLFYVWVWVKTEDHPEAFSASSRTIVIN